MLFIAVLIHWVLLTLCCILCFNTGGVCFPCALQGPLLLMSLLFYWTLVIWLKDTTSCMQKVSSPQWCISDRLEKHTQSKSFVGKLVMCFLCPCVDGVQRLTVPVSTLSKRLVRFSHLLLLLLQFL